MYHIHICLRTYSIKLAISHHSLILPTSTLSQFIRATNRSALFSNSRAINSNRYSQLLKSKSSRRAVVSVLPRIENLWPVSTLATQYLSSTQTRCPLLPSRILCLTISCLKSHCLSFSASLKDFRLIGYQASRNRNLHRPCRTPLCVRPCRV